MSAPVAATPPAAAPWNPLAIVAFVVAFVVPPAGIVCGHVALAQLRTGREQGRGFALAGAILGWVLTGLIALLVVLWLVLFAGIWAFFFGLVATLPDATTTPA